MLQNPCKTMGFKKNMVYKIPPGGEVNHIQPVAYKVSVNRVASSAVLEYAMYAICTNKSHVLTPIHIILPERYMKGICAGMR